MRLCCCLWSIGERYHERVFGVGIGSHTGSHVIGRGSHCDVVGRESRQIGNIERVCGLLTHNGGHAALSSGDHDRSVNVCHKLVFFSVTLIAGVGNGKERSKLTHLHRLQRRVITEVHYGRAFLAGNAGYGERCGTLRTEGDVVVGGGDHDIACGV